MPLTSSGDFGESTGVSENIVPFDWTASVVLDSGTETVTSRARPASATFQSVKSSARWPSATGPVST